MPAPAPPRRSAAPPPAPSGPPRRSAPRRPTLPPRLLLWPSARAGKKWAVGAPGWGEVHFGAAGYSDFTLHRDVARRDRYLARHRARETWTLAGVRTPGFWARWVLWNEPSVGASLRSLARRFPGLRVARGRGK